MEIYKEDKENLLYEGLKFLGQMTLTAIGATIVGIPLMYIGVMGIATAVPNELEIARRPPTFIDLNGDGVRDKIFYKIREEKNLFGRWNKLEKVVEYGIKVDGKEVYLTLQEFSYYNKITNKN